MRRLLIVTLILVGAVRAADPPPAPPTDTELQKAKQQAAFEQERLRRQFGDFQRSLLTLAQRYEKSAKAEDREKAIVLRQAIELATREGIDNQFNKLVAALTSSGITLQEINAAIGQNEQLSRNLREMIAILLSDSQSAKLKEEQRRLAELLKMLDAVLRAQKIERSKTEAGKLDGEQLAKGQAKVTADTKKLSDAMGKDKKAGDPKDGKGQPKDGKGQPKDGQPKDGQPKDGQPKDGQPKNGQGQPKDGDGKDGDKKDQPPSDDPPGREQVKDAIENQNNAEKNLKKNDKEKASNEQDEAIKKLEEVRKEIERRLKQMREEEQEKLLANLEARMQKMLGLQIEVYDATRRLHGTIQSNPDQKASRNEDLKAGDLSGREGQIVMEANKALQLLEEDGTAVAVPQVLEQARDDMKKVQALLFKTEVGPFCQGIEEDIIAALKEIIEALKKAQQELKDRKDQPPPPPGGNKPPDPLINVLAELRMLRNLQVKVNKRTIDYGKQYPGEQAEDVKIQEELRSLAERQVKIQKATKDIATGKAGGNQ
jgi:hypothetical protein